MLVHCCLTKLTVVRTPVYSKSISNAVTFSAQMNTASCAVTLSCGNWLLWLRLACV